MWAAACLSPSASLLTNLVPLCIFGDIIQSAPPNSFGSHFTLKEVERCVEKLLSSPVYSYSVIFRAHLLNLQKENELTAKEIQMHCLIQAYFYSLWILSRKVMKKKYLWKGMWRTWTDMSPKKTEGWISLGRTSNAVDHQVSKLLRTYQNSRSFVTNPEQPWQLGFGKNSKEQELLHIAERNTKC